jgi:hypothetical protein
MDLMLSFNNGKKPAFALNSDTILQEAEGIAREFIGEFISNPDIYLSRHEYFKASAVPCLPGFNTSLVFQYVLYDTYNSSRLCMYGMNRNMILAFIMTGDALDCFFGIERHAKNNGLFLLKRENRKIGLWTPEDSDYDKYVKRLESMINELSEQDIKFLKNLV